MNIKAVIFDMDGTLVNTERLWKQAERDMLSAHGRTYDHAIHKQFLGMAVSEFIPAVQTAYDLTHIAREILDADLESRVMRLLELETKPTIGANELVGYVVENNIPCAIASNSSHKIMHTTLSNQRWLDNISMRFSADDVPNPKPAPDLYLHVAKQLGVNPSACVAVEDSLTGVLSATSAGMTCIAVPDFELADIEAYRQATPHVFESLVDVLAFLKK